jgi:hypothetical protein
MRRLDRRWWLAIAVVVVALVGFVLSETVFGRPSEDCKPVIEMLEYNSEQGRLIAAKAGDSDNAAVPSVAEDAVYQQWSDGMAQRAQQVTEPNLANSAVKVADLTSQFVAKLPAARAAATNSAPGAPAPRVVFEMDILNQRITQGLDELAKACKD